MLSGNTLAQIEAIVLDLDDTLFDARAWQFAALMHGAQQRGMEGHCVERALNGFLETHAYADPGIFNAVLLGCCQSDNIYNIRALHEAVVAYRGTDQEWDPYPGVREALIELSWKYRLVLLAEGPVEAQKAKVNALGLSRIFESIFYSDEIEGSRSRRPDPRPFQRLREQLMLPASKILFVADNPMKDFKATRTLGIPSCRVFTGPWRNCSSPDPSREADFEVTSLARLPEILSQASLRASRMVQEQMAFLNGSAELESAPLPLSVEAADSSLFVAAEAALLASGTAPAALTMARALVDSAPEDSPEGLRERLVLLPEPPANGSLQVPRLQQRAASGGSLADLPSSRPLYAGPAALEDF